MATTERYFDELKSYLTMAMKSSYFNIGDAHWQWPSGLVVKEMMERQLAVARNLLLAV